MICRGGGIRIAVALFAFWQAADLPIGTLGSVGPGMLPMSLAVLFGLLGALLVLDSFLETSLPLEPWSIRGPVLVALHCGIRPNRAPIGIGCGRSGCDRHCRLCER